MRKNLSLLLHPLFAIAVGLVAGAIGILIIGESITETYVAMWNGAFGSFYFFTSTLARATPIMLIGLGVALAFRAGFFNLGAEGQMVLGAITAALTALYLPGPGWFKLIMALLAGFTAGGAWSLLAGWMETRFNVNLLISTLLMNYIAALFAFYLVTDPFRDRTGSAAMAQTAMIDRSAWLPKLFSGMSLHAGFFIALAAVIIIYLVIKYTLFGYHLRMLGSNPNFASYGGVNRGRMMLISLIIGGGLAGLAGSAEVLGMHYRYIEGALVGPGLAWTGLMAALLANSHPIGTAISALFLAALQTGGMGVERSTDVPLEISEVIQAVLILFISVKFTYSFIRRKKKGGTADGAATKDL